MKGTEAFFNSSSRTDWTPEDMPCDIYCLLSARDSSLVIYEVKGKQGTGYRHTEPSTSRE